MMKILYENTDISNMVQVKDCIVTDTCGNRCDSLDITFENAAGWYRWGPKEDDRIVVSLDGYDTGIMYLNTVMPEDGKYRIYATALPCKARACSCRTFIDNTIEDIMRSCARETGMGFQIFGIEGKNVIPYIQREYESCASFLARLLMFEGAALKCVNGKYTAIGIEYAQDRVAYKGFAVNYDQQNAYYTRIGTAYKSFEIKTPYVDVTATDTAVDDDHVSKTVSLPVSNAVQAGRWARGLLLSINRECESIVLQADFEPLITAMTRIDITGNTDATGEWLVRKTEHDLINLKTTIKAHRCLRSIR